MEGTQSPGAPTPQLWSELTCPSVQLPFSPTGIGRLLAGPQSCVRSKWPAWNDPLKSETQTTQRVDVVNVRSLGQHISHQDGGTLDFTHRLLYSPLPFIWQHSTAFPALSPASCFSLWEPGWPWEPLLRGKVRMTWCTPRVGLQLCCTSGSGCALARSGGKRLVQTMPWCPASLVEFVSPSLKVNDQLPQHHLLK